MPDATITSTASTFGTISGTFAADQSTITGTISGVVDGTLTGSVGVPGPQGATGATGATGPQGPQGDPGQGVPVGGTTGQVLKKASSTNYDTVWGTDLASAAWGTITGTLSSQTDLQTALDLKAPLASPAFTGNPTAPTAALADNDTSLATTAFVQQELASGVAVAKNLEVYVRNQTGATLSAGTIVYINGATGNRPTVTKAQANNDANSAQTFGFVKTSIADNGFGYVIVRGECENLDTSALTEGAQLYLSPTTAGTWTTTKPYAPDHLVYVGIVVRSHPTQGVILVAIQNGYELNEIHDVKITSVSNGQVLKYDSTQGLWVNGTDSSGVAWGGITGTLSAQTDLQSALDAKLSTATASSTYAPLDSPPLIGNVTITTNSASPALVIEQSGAGDVVQFRDQTSDTTYSFIDAVGKVNTVAATTSSAGFSIPHGTAPTTPVNGDIWTTTSGLFARVNNGTQQYANLGGNITFSNSSGTYTNGTATGTVNFATGATISGSTKTVNIGTSGAAGSTTTIAIGSTTGTSTTTLQGTTNGVTVAADTNSVALATTAFVVGQAGSATPLVDGTAAVGTSLRYARQDHVHPTDTSRAPLASPTFTGTPSLPTGTIAVTQSAGDNTTAVATTAFVQSALPVMATETQAIYGTSSTTTISPLLMRYILANPMLTTYNSLIGNYSSFVSGSGSVNAVWSNLFGLQITAANGKAAFQPNSQVSYHSIQSRGKVELTVDWTKPIWFSFRFCYSSSGSIGNSNTVNRVTIGKTSSVFGDLASAGIGVKWTAGTSGAFTVMAHNGTTLSTSASAVTVSNTTYFPTTSSAADFMVYSDGAGNVTLYCNNVQVATTTGGPSSGTVPGPRFMFEIDNTTSTSGTVTCDYFGVKSMLAY